MTTAASHSAVSRKLSASARVAAKPNLNVELKRLEELLNQLKLDYEQFFLGVTIYQPEKLQKEVKRQIRAIRKMPFKRPAARYKLRMLESRYHTFNDYWQRIMRQRETGSYSKDVFKAELRERNALEDQAALTAQGAANRGLQHLFTCYKRALESQTGCKQQLDYKDFKSALLKKARDYQAQHGEAKLKFSVVSKNGRVLIKAKVKEGGGSSRG